MSQEGAASVGTSDERIELVVDGALAEVHLNRPERLNALTGQMLRSLSEAIRSLGRRSGVKAIILTGRGRAFSAGDDLKESLELNGETFPRLIDSFQDITRAIVTSPVPVIAAINGIAVGGAAEITIACDVRIGGPETEFFFPENGIGLTISNGSTVLIPALTGRRAVGLVLLERRIGIDEAKVLGLVDQVVDDTAEVLPAARRLAHRLGEPTSSTSFHLELLRPSLEEIEIALERERIAAVRAWESGVVSKGLERFWEEKPSHS